MSATETFEHNYKTVRYLLVAGRINLRQAKTWLKTKGRQAEVHTAIEREERLKTLLGRRCGRDVDLINKIFGEDDDETKQ